MYQRVDECFFQVCTQSAGGRYYGRFNQGEKMTRIFVGQNLKKNESVTLLAPQSHYLTHVMRLTEGEKVICFNGRQGDWEATLAKQKKRMVFDSSKANKTATKT